MLKNNNTLTLGLIINPWAGIGGQLALKGSDGVREQALALGAKSRVQERVAQFLEQLSEVKTSLSFVSFPQSMGGELLTQQGFDVNVLSSSREKGWSNLSKADYAGTLPPQNISFTDAQDTQEAAQQMAQQKVDIIVFAGGDGTARDIAKVLLNYPEQVCLGIPAGVKIQSGVYARTPASAGRLVRELIQNTGVSLQLAEVRDIDEQALRKGELKSSRYADLLVPSFPEQGLFLQGSKLSAQQLASSAQENNSDALSTGEDLTAEEIAAYLIECNEDATNQLLIIGPGKTTLAFKKLLNTINPSKNTLLGVDVYLKGNCLLTDAKEQDLMALLENSEFANFSAQVVVSLIGGQGCVFGRGNQQLSADVLNKVIEISGKEAITVIASPHKITALQGKNLFVDTGNAELDQKLQGYCKVLVDYEHEMFCQIRN